MQPGTGCSSSLPQPALNMTCNRSASAPGLQTPPIRRLLQLIPADLRPAAVLIGLFEEAGEPGILLTVRAGHLRKHAGQIAFPGGTIETADASPAAAALREAGEEVGLAADEVRIIGYLPDQIVLTGFRITPVVARISGNFTPRIDAAEVERCFTLPICRSAGSGKRAAGDAQHRRYRSSRARSAIRSVPASGAPRPACCSRCAHWHCHDCARHRSPIAGWAGAPARDHAPSARSCFRLSLGPGAGFTLAGALCARGSL